MSEPRADRRLRAREALGSLLGPGLRTATLASKLVLTLYLARAVAPAELGIFGVTVASLTIAAQLLGVEFYTYANRELLGVEGERRPALLRNHAAFLGLAYLVGLPLSVFPFLMGWLPLSLLGWYLALLVAEHLAQEAFRLLVALGRPGVAHATLFLRGGAWVWPVVAAGVLWPAGRGLTPVWVGWLVGDLAALALAGVALRALLGPVLRRGRLDWRWIRRGLRMGLRFLAGSLAVAGIAYADRLALQHVHGEAAAGYYTFFWSLASAVPAIAYATWTVRALPGLVRAGRRGEGDALRRGVRRFALLMAPGAILLGLAAAWAVGPLLAWLDRPDYASELTAYRVLVAGAVVTAVGEVPFLALYALGRDRSVAITAVLALLLDIAALALLTPRFGLVGAALATLTARTALLAARAVLLKRALALPDGAGSLPPEPPAPGDVPEVSGRE